MRIAALLLVLSVTACAIQPAFGAEGRRARITKRCATLGTALDELRRAPRPLADAMALQEAALRLRVACEARQLSIASDGALSQRVSVLRSVREVVGARTAAAHTALHTTR